MKTSRTDLALEIRENFKEQTELSGVKVRESYAERGKIKITTVEILNSEGAQKMHKPTGKYVTIEIPNLLSEDELLSKKTISVFKEQLDEMLKDIKHHSDINALIVGLGNREIVADALGPKIIDQISVNRHLSSERHRDRRCKKTISAIAAGVLAQTGMENSEIISGLIKETTPDVIIAIDALAARSSKRLNTTIQLTNTGICPGSGIGNNRIAIDKETLGVPVIAIGIPTVIDAMTIVRENLGRILRNQGLSDEEADFYADEIGKQGMDNMFVTPKNIDLCITYVSRLISEGINEWTQK